FPEQEVSDGKASIHGIEQVTHFRVRPDERALDVRQADVADIDIVEEPGKIVINALETGLQLTHTPSPTSFSASRRGISPDMSLGNSKSRSSASVRFSWIFAIKQSVSGMTMEL